MVKLSPDELICTAIENLKEEAHFENILNFLKNQMDFESNRLK